MVGFKWTSEENITTLLLVPYVTRQKLTEIFKFLHEDGKRRYFFNDRSSKAINSHVCRLIDGLNIDGNNSNLSPAAIAYKLHMEWDMKNVELRLANFIDSILEDIESKFPDLKWTEIKQRVEDIKESLEGSEQASGEHS